MWLIFCLVVALDGASRRRSRRSCRRCSCRSRSPRSGSSCAGRGSRSATCGRPRGAAGARSAPCSRSRRCSRRSSWAPWPGRSHPGACPPDGGGDRVTSWLNLTSLLIGALFVATCAYLAAVFLVDDARRAGERELEAYFRRRALGGGARGRCSRARGAARAARMTPARCSTGSPATPSRWWSLSGLAGVGAMVLLARSAPRGSRALAVIAVATIVWGWGRRPVPLPPPRPPRRSMRRPRTTPPWSRCSWSSGWPRSWSCRPWRCSTCSTSAAHSMVRARAWNVGGRDLTGPSRVAGP